MLDSFDYIQHDQILRCHRCLCTVSIMRKAVLLQICTMCQGDGWQQTAGEHQVVDSITAWSEVYVTVGGAAGPCDFLQASLGCKEGAPARGAPGAAHQTSIRESAPRNPTASMAGALDEALARMAD